MTSSHSLGRGVRWPPPRGRAGGALNTHRSGRAGSVPPGGLMPPWQREKPSAPDVTQASSSSCSFPCLLTRRQRQSVSYSTCVTPRGQTTRRRGSVCARASTPPPKPPTPLGVVAVCRPSVQCVCVLGFVSLSVCDVRSFSGGYFKRIGSFEMLFIFLVRTLSLFSAPSSCCKERLQIAVTVKPGNTKDLF